MDLSDASNVSPEDSSSEHSSRHGKRINANSTAGGDGDKVTTVFPPKIQNFIPPFYSQTSQSSEYNKTRAKAVENVEQMSEGIDKSKFALTNYIISPWGNTPSIGQRTVADFFWNQSVVKRTIPHMGYRFGTHQPSDVTLRKRVPGPFLLSLLRYAPPFVPKTDPLTAKRVVTQTLPQAGLSPHTYQLQTENQIRQQVYQTQNSLQSQQQQQQPGTQNLNMAPRTEQTQSISLQNMNTNTTTYIGFSPKDPCPNSELKAVSNQPAINQTLIRSELKPLEKREQPTCTNTPMYIKPEGQGREFVSPEKSNQPQHVNELRQMPTIDDNGKITLAVIDVSKIRPHSPYPVAKLANNQLNYYYKNLEVEPPKDNQGNNQTTNNLPNASKGENNTVSDTKTIQNTPNGINAIADTNDNSQLGGMRNRCASYERTDTQQNYQHLGYYEDINVASFGPCYTQVLKTINNTYLQNRNMTTSDLFKLIMANPSLPTLSDGRKIPYYVTALPSSKSYPTIPEITYDKNDDDDDDQEDIFDLKFKFVPDPSTPIIVRENPRIRFDPDINEVSAFLLVNKIFKFLGEVPSMCGGVKSEPKSGTLTKTSKFTPLKLRKAIWKDFSEDAEMMVMNGNMDETPAETTEYSETENTSEIEEEEEEDIAETEQTQDTIESIEPEVVTTESYGVQVEQIEIDQNLRTDTNIPTASATLCEKAQTDETAYDQENSNNQNENTTDTGNITPDDCSEDYNIPPIQPPLQPASMYAQRQHDNFKKIMDFLNRKPPTTPVNSTKPNNKTSQSINTVDQLSIKGPSIVNYSRPNHTPIIKFRKIRRYEIQAICRATNMRPEVIEYPFLSRVRATEVVEGRGMKHFKAYVEVPSYKRVLHNISKNMIDGEYEAFTTGKFFFTKDDLENKDCFIYSFKKLPHKQIEYISELKIYLDDFRFYIDNVERENGDRCYSVYVKPKLEILKRIITHNSDKNGEYVGYMRRYLSQIERFSYIVGYISDCGISIGEPIPLYTPSVIRHFLNFGRTE